MLNAIYKGKLARGFFENNPDAISTIFENGQTALYLALTAGQLRIGKELITSTSEANHFGIRDKRGNTAFLCCSWWDDGNC
ncbi:hypothetical protein SLA2020_048020 [Shorea laevis]